MSRSFDFPRVTRPTGPCSPEWSDWGTYRSTNGGFTWSSGTGVNDETVGDLALSPTFPTDQTVFAATAGGGVFQSTDKGDTWSPKNNGLLDLKVSSLAISPAFPVDQTLFAGTEAGKVYTSTNAGGLWSDFSSGLPAGHSIFSLGISPNYADDRTLFAGFFGNGVYRSVGGGNWSPLNAGLTDPYVRQIALSPGFKDDQTLYAAAHYGGIFKSTDGGNSWHPANEGLPYPDMQRLVLSANYVVDGTLYAAFGQVYLSTNRGNNWSNLGDVPWAGDTLQVWVSPPRRKKRCLPGSMAVRFGVMVNIKSCICP